MTGRAGLSGILTGGLIRDTFAPRSQPKGGIGPVRKGREGERAVGISGPKRSIAINGRTRIPDQVTADRVIEVKNVGRLSYGQQLRDYADYARTTERTLELYVRSSTRLSGPLRAAHEAGEVIIRTIPGM